MSQAQPILSPIKLGVWFCSILHVKPFYFNSHFDKDELQAARFANTFPHTQFHYTACDIHYIYKMIFVTWSLWIFSVPVFLNLAPALSPPGHYSNCFVNISLNVSCSFSYGAVYSASSYESDFIQFTGRVSLTAWENSASMPSVAIPVCRVWKISVSMLTIN